MKFIISDYCSMTSKLGIFLYDERILFGWEKPLGPKTYKFRLKLCYFSNIEEQWDARLNPDKLSENNCETINFIKTCNLKDYTKSFYRKFDNKVVTDIHWEKLLDSLNRKQYRHSKERLKRKVLSVIPEPMYFTDDYNQNIEFLEFTEESSWSWGGPYTHNDKKGCSLKVRNHTTDHRESLINIPPVDENHSYYNLPRNIDDKLINWIKLSNKDEIDVKNLANLHYRLPKNEKLNFFHSLDISEQLQTAKNYYRNFDEEHFDSLLPFSIYLAGNDDCSYTRYFKSMENVEKELSYLRKIQPLDFNKDIQQRKYYFTN